MEKNLMTLDPLWFGPWFFTSGSAPGTQSSECVSLMTEIGKMFNGCNFQFVSGSKHWKQPDWWRNEPRGNKTKLFTMSHYEKLSVYSLLQTIFCASVCVCVCAGCVSLNRDLIYCRGKLFLQPRIIISLICSETEIGEREVGKSGCWGHTLIVSVSKDVCICFSVCVGIKTVLKICVKSVWV